MYIYSIKKLAVYIMIQVLVFFLSTLVKSSKYFVQNNLDQ